MIPTARQIRQLREDSKRWPETLRAVPRETWPITPASHEKPIELWRSRRFLVQIYEPKSGAQRMTICTTEPIGSTWRDGITWDDIQLLKAECGRAESWAVEIFPAKNEIVNVANMRHVWLLPNAPEFAWRKA